MDRNDDWQVMPLREDEGFEALLDALEDPHADLQPDHVFQLTNALRSAGISDVEIASMGPAEAATILRKYQRDLDADDLPLEVPDLHLLPDPKKEQLAAKRVHTVYESRGPRASSALKRVLKAKDDLDQPHFEGMEKVRRRSFIHDFDLPEGTVPYATPDRMAIVKADMRKMSAFKRYKREGFSTVAPAGTGSVGRYVSATSLLLRGWPVDKIDSWLLQAEAHNEMWVKKKGAERRTNGIRTLEAAKQRRTIFSSRVMDPLERDDGETILKDCNSNPKLGAKVISPDGRWIGDIRTLALEERATCPTTCAVWEDCYGNNMNNAKRWHYADNRKQEFFEALRNEIDMLYKRVTKPRNSPNGRDNFPNGRDLYIRLHELGDFPSVDYVAFWKEMIETYPRLRVWGYTHRHPGQGDGIGEAIQALNDQYWKTQFRIYSSNTHAKTRSANVFENLEDARGTGHVSCFEQQGIAGTCGECGLCLPGPESRGRDLESNIAFGKH